MSCLTNPLIILLENNSVVTIRPYFMPQFLECYIKNYNIWLDSSLKIWDLHYDLLYVNFKEFLIKSNENEKTKKYQNNYPLISVQPKSQTQKFLNLSLKSPVYHIHLKYSKLFVCPNSKFPYQYATDYCNVDNQCSLKFQRNKNTIVTQPVPIGHNFWYTIKISSASPEIGITWDVPCKGKGMSVLEGNRPFFEN